MARVVRKGAQRGEAILNGPPLQLFDETRAEPAAAAAFVDDERPHLGHGTAQRRELGASGDLAFDVDDEEPADAARDVLSRARQQMAGARDWRR